MLSKEIARGCQGFKVAPPSATYFLRTTMDPTYASRSRLCYYSFVLFGLGLLVFTWGLQYKLSLYSRPDSAARHMVKAKLLANDKRVGSTDGIVTNSHADDAQAWSAFTLTAVFVPLVAISILRSASARQVHEISAYDPSWRALCDASFNAFFFRPPPISS